MSQQVNLKKLTKTELNSVLVSAPRSIPVNRLHAEFIQLVGKPIQFREMGYNDLEEFLNDIPDVITLRWIHNQLMAFPVIHEKNQHIANMVARQRKPPVKHAREQYVRSAVPDFYKEQPRPTGQFCISVIRGKVKELLYSYSSGLKASQFMEAYARRFGHYLNLYGYKSELELLRSMSDLVDLQSMDETDDDVLIVSKCPVRHGQ